MREVLLFGRSSALLWVGDQVFVRRSQDDGVNAVLDADCGWASVIQCEDEISDIVECRRLVRCLCRYRNELLTLSGIATMKFNVRHVPNEQPRPAPILCPPTHCINPHFHPRHTRWNDLCRPVSVPRISTAENVASLSAMTAMNATVDRTVRYG